jgi:hypothetical protein
MEQTLVLIGTIIVGVVGALIFYTMQPEPAKKRAKGNSGDLKPRGTLPTRHATRSQLPP